MVTRFGKYLPIVKSSEFRCSKCALACAEEDICCKGQIVLAEWPETCYVLRGTILLHLVSGIDLAKSIQTLGLRTGDIGVTPQMMLEFSRRMKSDRRISGIAHFQSPCSGQACWFISAASRH
jgi:hypothetical protein